MGGESKQETQTQSQTQPWEPAQPLLKGILGQLNGQLGNTGITQNETNALNAFEQNNPQIQSYAQTLLKGGGATDQAGNVQSGYDAYKAATTPLATNTDYNPYNTPGFATALKTMAEDISNGINGQFASAGRDFSGLNGQTVARGIAQGVAPTIAAQYNQNVTNQQGAASNLYNASNTNAGILTGLQQQSLTNQGQGASAATDSMSATLAAEAARRGIPLQSLGLLAQIGIPIAGLGQQSSGTSTTTGQMSGAQQFATIAGGIGSLGGLWGGGKR